MSVILECDHTSFAYPGQPVILDTISWQLFTSSYTWLRGPSGSGKSTLLRLLCRLLEPTTGEISFNGKPLREIDPPSLRRQVMYLHQTPVVLEASVRDNLLLPFTFALNHDLDRPDEKVLSARLEEMLLTGVSLETPAAGLSVGQKQRLCLLRAMLLGPAVLLLDEPVAALDKESAAVVLAMVQRLHRDQGTTVIMVAHGEELLHQPGVTKLVLKEKKIVQG
jgi:putative ABC transport system ATP-binding protein